MPCPHLPALRARIATLRGKYVAAQLAAQRADPLAYVPDTDNLAAFRLLAHAEFEEYLETKARDGLSAIESAFNGGRVAVRDNLSLLVIARALDRELRFETRHWAGDVRDTLRTAREWISKNNGIKDVSFTMLSIFSGKMPDEVDQGLSASLSTYGTNRGDVAHRSVARVTNIQTPSDEAHAAENLVNGLEAYFA